MKTLRPYLFTDPPVCPSRPLLLRFGSTPRRRPPYRPKFARNTRHCAFGRGSLDRVRNSGRECTMGRTRIARCARFHSYHTVCHIALLVPSTLMAPAADTPARHAEPRTKRGLKRGAILLDVPAAVWLNERRQITGTNGARASAARTSCSAFASIRVGGLACAMWCLARLIRGRASRHVMA
jgi:hypothetical protein